MPLYAYQSTSFAPACMNFHDMFRDDQTDMNTRVVVFKKGETLTFVEMGRTKIGIVMTEVFEGDTDILMSEFEPSEADALVLQKNMEKTVKVDRIKDKLTMTNNDNVDSFSISERMFEEVYSGRDGDAEEEPIPSEVIARAQTVGSARGQRRQTKPPKRLADYVL